MNLKLLKVGLLCCAFGALTVSCEKEDVLVDANAPAAGAKASKTKSAEKVNFANATLPKTKSNLTPLVNSTRDALHQQYLRSLRGNAVAPSECGPTEFDEVIDYYVDQFGDYEWAEYSFLAELNFYSTLLNTDAPQTFGADGHLTNFAAKEKRTLEKFWGGPSGVKLRGQHTSTLLNRDIIYETLITFYVITEAEAQILADAIVDYVRQSEVLMTTPLLSLDGFATDWWYTGDLIVIGDGIVQMLAETGLDEKIVFAGIASHEWAHQLQFDNMEDWYGNGELPEDPSASTRLTELEADFFTGYYLTHKRGGTYNWKRAEQFFELFFNIGDCSFASSGHHGTPIQRMAAAYAGYLVAQETFPKGHILSEDEIHERFLEVLDEILAGTVM